MKNEIAKNLKCVVMRNGIEIWKEEDRLNELGKALLGARVGFIKLDDDIINAADVVGIFSAKTMEEFTRRKNGQWKCDYGVWHDKNKKCECWVDKLTTEKIARYARGF